VAIEDTTWATDQTELDTDMDMKRRIIEILAEDRMLDDTAIADILSTCNPTPNTVFVVSSHYVNTQDL